jgi:hypothetical protein
VDIHVIGDEDISGLQVVIIALDMVGHVARNKEIKLVKGMLVERDRQGLFIIIVVELKVRIHHILPGLELLSAADHKNLLPERASPSCLL